MGCPRGQKEVNNAARGEPGAMGLNGFPETAFSHQRPAAQDAVGAPSRLRFPTHPSPFLAAECEMEVRDDEPLSWTGLPVLDPRRHL
jgi:hypothetical protein